MKQIIDIVRSRKKFFLIVFSALVIGIVLLVLDMIVLGPKVESLQTQWFEKRRQMQAAGSRDVATVYHEGKKDLATFQEMIPRKREFPRVVSQIFETAHANNLKIGTISYKTSPVSKGVVAYGIGLDLSGKYAGIKSFISDMQAMKEMVILDSVALSGSVQGEESVSLKLQATIYLKTEDR